MKTRHVALAVVGMAAVLLVGAAPFRGAAADELAASNDLATCRGDDAINHARDLRQAVGLAVDEAALAAGFADSAYSCDKYGIPLTPAEAAQFDAVVAAQSQLSDLAESVASSPDFGGAYLEGPTLTIRTTNGDLQKSIEDQLTNVSKTASVVVIPADYTQKDLDVVSDDIAAKFASYIDAGVQISLVAVDAKTNRVTVGVTSDVNTANKVFSTDFGDMVKVISKSSSPLRLLDLPSELI